jgi:hypothetical protein
MTKSTKINEDVTKSSNGNNSKTFKNNVDSQTSSITESNSNTSSIVIKSESDSVAAINTNRIIYSTFIHSLPLATSDKTLIIVIVLNAFKIKEHLQNYHNNKNIKKDELLNKIDNLSVDSDVKMAIKTLLAPEPVFNNKIVY